MNEQEAQIVRIMHEAEFTIARAEEEIIRLQGRIAILEGLLHMARERIRRMEEGEL